MMKILPFTKLSLVLFILLLSASFACFAQSKEDVRTQLITAKKIFDQRGLSSSLKLSKTSLAHAQTLKNDQLIWETQNLIGEIYLTQKDYQKAIHLFLELTLSAERVFNFSISANGYLSLANIYSSMGALRKANEAYATAYEQFDKIDYEMGMIEVMFGSGFNSLRLNHLDNALVEFNILRSLAEKDSIPYFVLIAHDGLLEVYQKQGNLEEGEKTGQAYLELIEQEGGSDQMAIKAHNQLALLYLNKVKYQKSIDELKIAEVIGNATTGINRVKTETLNLFINVYAAMGDQSTANKYRKLMTDSKTPLANIYYDEDIEAAETLARELENTSRAILEEKLDQLQELEKERRSDIQNDERNRLSRLENETLIGNREFGHSALEAEFIHQDLMVAQHEYESVERQAEILRYKEELSIHKLELKVAQEEKLILLKNTEIQEKENLVYMIVGGAILLISVILGVEYVRITKLNRILANQQETIHQRNVELEMSNATIMAKNAKLHRAHGDIQERNQELKNTQSSLIQAEKMSALGLLTAGIAHEINNPISFVSNGLQVLEENMAEVFEQIAQYDRVFEFNDLDQIKLEYQRLSTNNTPISELKEDSEELIKDAKFGTTRIVEIVDGLSIFSRKDELIFKKVGLTEIIDSALLITKSKYKGRIQIIKEYDEHVPLIDCFPGQLNQIFINLIGNASDAIEGDGWLKVIVQSLGDKHVRAIVQDNGSGMSEDVKKQIFEPLFTTKESGKGTGLGLSITMDILKKHEGHIDVRSKAGVGTAFIVTLKVNIQKSDPLEA